MRRVALTILFAAAGWAGVTTSSALAADLCVGGTQPACFSGIQAAVDAAQDGDVVHVRPGTYVGGITINTSLELVGAGAAATRIVGGGPVITVGEQLAATQPTVSISRVTITGGLSRRGFNPSDSFAGVGGGVFVPPAAEFKTGATVRISDAVITGNRAEPATALPFPCTPAIICEFGYAEAGGISNFGTMTLIDTQVTNNDAGAPAGVSSPTSFASGGGIYNHVQGVVTIARSVVSGNHVRATRPNAIMATGGGITTYGRLELSDSFVADNSVVVESEHPTDVGPASFTGGIEVTGPASALITRTMVRGNIVSMTNAGGDALAGVGGISTDEDVSLVLRDSTIAHNSVTASTSAPGANAVTFAGGIELEGAVEVSGSRVIGNEVRAEAPAGLAGAAGGGIHAEGLTPIVVTDSVVTGNSVSAVSAGGFALGVGGGIVNGGLLTLRGTVVNANSASATGPAGFASGGGIQNWVIPVPGSPQVVELTLIDSVVVANRLSSSSGLTLQGGGIFTQFPLLLTRTVVSGNKPDQCFGC